MTEKNTQPNEDDRFKGFTVHDDTGVDPEETKTLAERAPADPPANDDAGADDAGADDAGADDTGADDTGADDTGADDTSTDDDPADDDSSADDTAADDAGADDADGADGATADDTPPKKKLSVKERINQVVKARGKEERRANTAEAEGVVKDARIAELESQLTDKQAGGTEDSDTSSDGDGKPDPAEFEYGELDSKYTEALTDWTVDQRLNARDKAQETTRQQEAAQEQAAELTTQYETALTNGIEAYPDFEQVVRQGADADDYPLTEDTVMMALDSDVGHHVLYEIASNLPLATKLAQMPPLMQAREFGRLEARYAPEGATSTQTKRATKAPPPPTPRSGGKGAQPFNPGGSFKDFEARFLSERRSKR